MGDVWDATVPNGGGGKPSQVRDDQTRNRNKSASVGGFAFFAGRPHLIPTRIKRLGFSDYTTGYRGPNHGTEQYFKI